MSIITTSLLDCPVCLESFNDRAQQPRFLPCGHSMCVTCLADIIKGPTAARHCPECRKPLPWVKISPSIPTPPVAIFPVCYALLRLKADSRSSITSSSWDDTRCSIDGHQREPIIVFCRRCCSALCVQCLLTPTHDGHKSEVVPISTHLESLLQKASDPTLFPSDESITASSTKAKEKAQMLIEQVDRIITSETRPIIRGLETIRESISDAAGSWQAALIQKCEAAMKPARDRALSDSDAIITLVEKQDRQTMSLGNEMRAALSDHRIEDATKILHRASAYALERERESASSTAAASTPPPPVPPGLTFQFDASDLEKILKQIRELGSLTITVSPARPPLPALPAAPVASLPTPLLNFVDYFAPDH